MKYLYLTLILSFLTFNLFSQNRMKITLNNGKIKSGTYKIKSMSFGFPTKTKIISTQGREKYTLKEIDNIMVYTETDSVYLEAIQTKKYLNTKKINNKLAQIGYDGEKIKLYYVSEILYQGGAIGNFTTVGSYNEKYVKRTNDKIAYNMGYIYGAGQRGIKKRVRDYFTDCPRLIETVEKNKIEKDDTLKIALFYEENCEK